MSQDLSNLYPEIYSKKALTILHENIVLPRLITREFNEEQPRGDVVNMFLPATSTPSLNTSGSVSYGEHSFGKKSVTVNKWLYDKKKITDKDLALALYNPDEFIRLFIEPMAKGIANYIDKGIMQLYKDVYWFVGTAGDPPDSLDDIKAVYRRFRELKIPQPWHVVMSPVGYVDFMVSEVVKANERGNNQTLNTGDIPMFMGMNLYLAQNLDEATGGLHTIGGWYDAADPQVDQADVAVGDLTVHVEGLATSSTGEIADGDLFYVADDATRGYVATAAANSDSNGDADITFTGAAQEAWANDANITVVKPSSGQTFVNNLAFNPEAFGMVSRSLGTAGEMFGGLRVSEVNQDGISIRVSIGYDHTIPGPYVMLDTLYGVGTIRPEMAIRVLG